MQTPTSPVLHFMRQEFSDVISISAVPSEHGAPVGSVHSDRYLPAMPAAASMQPATMNAKTIAALIAIASSCQHHWCRAWSVVQALSQFDGKDDLPVGFHAHDCPATRDGNVECAVKPAEPGAPVIGVFTLGVGMVQDDTQARTRTCGHPLKQFDVGIRVAESNDGSPSHPLIYAGWTTGTFTNYAHLRKA